jgi:DNA gyrase/topoisomerase IV subunit A
MNTLKLVNLKSYNLVSKELSSNPTLYEVPSISFKIDDNNDIFVFTNLGNCIKIHVKDIPECKFRDKGLPLFNVAKNIDSHEKIIGAIGVDKSIKKNQFIFVTKKGMIKISNVEEYISNKQVVSGIKLSGDDELLMVDVFNPHKKLTMFTESGNGIKVETKDIAITGRNSVGIKGIALDKGDVVIGAMQNTISDAFTLFMSDGSAKIIKQNDVADSVRNRKGLSFISSKSKNAKIIKVDKLSLKTNYIVKTAKEKLITVLNNSLPIDTRIGGGKVVVKEKVDSIYSFVESK